MVIVASATISCWRTHVLAGLARILECGDALAVERADLVGGLEVEPVDDRGLGQPVEDLALGQGEGARPQDALDRIELVDPQPADQRSQSGGLHQQGEQDEAGGQHRDEVADLGRHAMSLTPPRPRPGPASRRHARRPKG